MVKFSVFLSLPFLLAGCLTESPGEQCLNSFRMDLKDPDSGKVISFSDSKLTYSATNTYGARTQANALCFMDDNKWKRNRHLEMITALNLATNRMKESTKCIKNGGDIENCRRMHGSGADASSSLKEAMSDLGFN